MNRYDKNKTCCFFGHRKINETDELKQRLYEEVEKLIERGVNTFLFGSKSEFNDLCYDIVTNLKEKYSNIKRVYVRAEFPHISDEYKNYLLQSYEDTYYPEKILDAGKAVYVERNYEMIDNSLFCIAYYSEEYKPAKRKNNKKDLTEYQPKSGTKLAYDYAIKKKSVIINVG